MNDLQVSTQDKIRQSLRDEMNRETNKVIAGDEIIKNIMFALYFLFAIIGFISVLRNKVPCTNYDNV